jgi:hypothetical protein
MTQMTQRMTVDDANDAKDITTQMTLATHVP